MLKGEAKKLYQREYMREYMRRRRSGVKTPLRPVKTHIPVHPEAVYSEPVDFGA